MGILLQMGKAARAVFTATSSSPGEEQGISAKRAPSWGEMTGILRAEALAIKRPPMKFFIRPYLPALAPDTAIGSEIACCIRIGYMAMRATGTQAEGPSLNENRTEGLHLPMSPSVLQYSAKK